MALSSDPEKRARQLANLRPAPPAPFGNQRALRSGTKTKTPPGMDPARAQIMRDVGAAVPVRGPDGELPDEYLLIVELLAREMARNRFMDDYVAKYGVIGRGGKLRPVVPALDRSTRTVMELLDRLGLHPQAKAKLGISHLRGFDLASQFAALDDDG